MLLLYPLSKCMYAHEVLQEVSIIWNVDFQKFSISISLMVVLRPVYTTKIMRIECKLILMDCIHTEFTLSRFELKPDYANPPTEVVWMRIAIWIRIDVIMIYFYIRPYSLCITIESKVSTIHRSIYQLTWLLVSKHRDDR